MRRILIVLAGPPDGETLRNRCPSSDFDAVELAVCCVLPAGRTGLSEGLLAQRELTSALRGVLGEVAERVTVLVAWDEDGYRVEDCARDWGATEVRT